MKICDKNLWNEAKKMWTIMSAADGVWWLDIVCLLSMRLWDFYLTFKIRQAIATFFADFVVQTEVQNRYLTK